MSVPAATLVCFASRMRTTGEPMKIQMTYETKMLLDNLGGYVSEVRGQVEVKGKGLMDTYWLLSKKYAEN